MATPLIIAFLKLPQAGRVKTRLAASLGEEEAVVIYRQLVDRVLQNLPDSADLRVCFDPPESEAAVRAWLALSISEREGHVDFRPQVAGDLGERLQAGFREAFADGYSQVAVIGGDCITMTPEHFSRSWALLEDGCDVVYGPAVDGGYYLQALDQLHETLFREIDWGKSTVLESCQKAAAQYDLQVKLLEPLSDVDELEDWFFAKNLL